MSRRYAVDSSATHRDELSLLEYDVRLVLAAGSSHRPRYRTIEVQADPHTITTLAPYPSTGTTPSTPTSPGLVSAGEGLFRWSKMYGGTGST